MKVTTTCVCLQAAGVGQNAIAYHFSCAQQGFLAPPLVGVYTPTFLATPQQCQIEMHLNFCLFLSVFVLYTYASILYTLYGDVNSDTLHCWFGTRHYPNAGKYTGAKFSGELTAIHLMSTCRPRILYMVFTCCKTQPTAGHAVYCRLMTPSVGRWVGESGSCRVYGETNFTCSNQQEPRELCGAVLPLYFSGIPKIVFQKFPS